MQSTKNIAGSCCTTFYIFYVPLRIKCLAENAEKSSLTHWFTRKKVYFCTAKFYKHKNMESTIIIPRKPRISLSVPSSYIGKQVKVTFALLDKTDKPKPATRLSDMFRGVLSKESAESFNEHIKTMREEWDSI